MGQKHAIEAAFILRNQIRFVIFETNLDRKFLFLGLQVGKALVSPNAR